MPKHDKNGKKPSGKNMKPCDKSPAGACQYNVYDDVVEKKKVKEKDVFDKKSSPRQKKTKKY